MEEQYLLEKEKISTGIKDFDLALFGGYLKPSSIAFLGNSEQDKNVFGYNLMSARQSICIATDASPIEIINKARTFNIDLSKTIFIDAYSKTTGIKPREEDIVVFSHSSLNEISIALSNAIANMNEPKVCFMSFSTTLNSVPITSATAFLQVINGKVKAKNGSILYVINSEIHDKQDLNKILYLIGETYYLEKKDDKKFIKSERLNMPLRYLINSTGVQILWVK